MLPALLAKPHVLVMGVLNVTPDSFSDGGEFLDPAAALTQAERLIADGADILDIGAESTRPYGSTPISADEEMARLAPILPALVGLGVPVSIDTMKASVAAWALDQGAAVLNDVWGLHRDPAMAKLAAGRGVPVVVMHNRDEADPAIDIMKDVIAFFERSFAIADKAGLPRDSIVLDPGIGFGKTPEQSMIALGRIGELSQFGRPILVGASR
jgi:dihydropteroate synthase